MNGWTKKYQHTSQWGTARAGNTIRAACGASMGTSPNITNMYFRVKCKGNLNISTIF